jgi:hypothetical protein
MLYNININQKAVIDNQWDNLGLAELAVFTMIEKAIDSKILQTYIDQSGTWYWLAHSKIIEELPILRISSKKTTERYLYTLVEYKLIELHPQNKQLGRLYLRLGDEVKKLHFTPQTKMSEGTSKMSDPSDKNVLPPQTKMSDNNNTNIININNSVKETKNSINSDSIITHPLFAMNLVRFLELPKYSPIKLLTNYESVIANELTRLLINKNENSVSRYTSYLNAGLLDSIIRDYDLNSPKQKQTSNNKRAISEL